MPSLNPTRPVCAHKRCGEPILTDNIKGTPYHGQCWLSELRRRWRKATSDFERQSIEQTADAVREHLRKNRA